YQSAAQLAAALDALIGSYRFDPKELRQFMRQLFRKEYAKEVEDTQMSLDASVASGSSASFRTQTSPQLPLPSRTPTQPMPLVEPTDAPTTGGDKPRGFWGSLFKKRK